MAAWDHVNWEGKSRKEGCCLVSGPWWPAQHLAFYPECRGRVVSRGMTIRSVVWKRMRGGAGG